MNIKFYLCSTLIVDYSWQYDLFSQSNNIFSITMKAENVF